MHKNMVKMLMFLCSDVTRCSKKAQNGAREFNGTNVFDLQQITTSVNVHHSFGSIWTVVFPRMFDMA